MAPYHDRMPVLLAGDDIEAWLIGSLGQAALKPAVESALRERPLSKRVNSSRSPSDDPFMIEP
jgi:putative SOS response-associated peptidase YedK